jgi:hypothetical protein
MKRNSRLLTRHHSILLSGHTGIGDSSGVIHDFAGPYHINTGSLSFGRTTRYLQLNPEDCHLKSWDAGVNEGCEIYKGRNHNLIMDNCHSHVAKCLNVMGYSKFVFLYTKVASTHICDSLTLLLSITITERNSTYDMVKIGVWMFFCGKFVSIGGFIKSYAPFTFIVCIIAVLSGVFA